MEQNCLFCKIIRKEIPATIVHEDDKTLAFLDINPVTEGHTLLIPKEHHAWIHETPDALLGDIFVTVKKIILALKEAFSADYVSVNVEGKDVPHFHIHLIPRYYDDNAVTWKHIQYKEGGIEQTAEKIKNLLI